MKIEKSENKEAKLLHELASIIEQGKKQVTAQVNSTITITYWHIGKRINDHLLNNKRAEYSKEIVPSLAKELVSKFGRSFATKNLYRMMQFSEIFTEPEIVVPLARKLSWSHFIALLPIKNEDARNYYANKAIDENWSKRELRRQIERKSFERQEIAAVKTTFNDEDLNYTFKDPYFLDFLELKDGYLEKDLETAIIKELENFILELGRDFTFVERQKRIVLDGKDFYIDLLFFHRKLKRLIVIELKLDDFKPAYKGQMELYLKWLDKNDKNEGENGPIGLILCAGKSTEQIELMDLQKDGIMVAEYWTELPPKEKLEKKLHEILLETKNRIENNKLIE